MILFDTAAWLPVGAAIGSAAIAVLLAFRVARLSTRLERAREEARRARRLSGLAGSLDLEAVAERVVEAARELPGVDAASLTVPLAKEAPLAASSGQIREKADGRLVLPLAGGDGSPGTLEVLWRGSDRGPSGGELAALDELAASAGAAIENAIRFRDASRLADLDALTGLHNRRFFHETLDRECARALRYERRLALLIFDVDDFKAINDRIGHLSGDTVLAQLAERVRAVARAADVPCRVGGDEFAVILPESSVEQGEQLYRRLGHAVSESALGPTDRLTVSGGLAEYRPGDTPTAFFERADEALYRAKQYGKGRAIAADD